MSNPASNPGRARTAKLGGRSLTVLELTVVLEEHDRVVAELEESLTELALPFDETSRFLARAAIASARRRD